MKRIVFIIFLMLFMAGCAPKPTPPSATQNPATTTNTPVTPEITLTVRQTATLPADTPVPAPIKEAGAWLYLSYFDMVDANHGWAFALGEGVSRSYILQTVDGGDTWMDVTPPQLITIRNNTHFFTGNVAALDANTAWAIADGGYPVDDRSLYGTVWHTEDGGLSWYPGNPINIYKPGPHTIVNGFTTNLYFLNRQEGWLKAIIEGVMAHTFDAWFRTTDGGLTWTRFGLPPDCADYVTCSYLFVDQANGFRTLPSMGMWTTLNDILTSDAWQIEKTEDGGATWSRLALTPPANIVELLSGGQDYQPAEAAGFKINIYERFKPFDYGAIGLRMDFVIYSEEDQTNPLFKRGIYYINNPGSPTWQDVEFIGDVFFLSEALGWRFAEQDGGYILERTTDRGNNWSSIGNKMDEQGRLQFTDEHLGWLVVQRAAFDNRLLRTVDGGQTWTDVTANIWETLLQGTFSNNPAEVTTTIPEEPWIARMQAGSPLVLDTIHMFEASEGWATSLNGYIFHTGDGGVTWQDVTPQYGTIDKLRSFAAAGASHAWTVILPLPGCVTPASGPPASGPCPDYYSNIGPVWYTRDGGVTWNPGGKFPDLDHTLEAEPVEIQFTNETLGWAKWLSRDINANQAIFHLYKTTDGGLTWTHLITEPYQREVLFLNELTGYKFEKSPGWAKTLDEFMAGSALGGLQKTLDGGETWDPIMLPNFVFNLEDVGLKKEDVSTIFSDCSFPEMYPFGAQGIAIKVPCFIVDVANIGEYYYSPDGGKSWNNWTSDAYNITNYAQPRWEQWFSSSGEFFLEEGIGWRLFKSGPDSPAGIQHTVDGGRSWKTIKNIAWQEAKFSFVNERDGWAIVTIGDEVALVHTSDGGKNWEEIKPIVASP